MQPDNGALSGGLDSGQTQALIQTIRDNAERLGLTWQITPATVVSPTPLTAVLDGDTEAIDLIDMLETVLDVGDRVYVMKVPPSGNYAVGRVAVYDSMISRVDTVTSVAGILVETAVLTAPSATYTKGRAYLWRTDFRINGTVAAFISVALRKNSVAGTVLASGKFYTMPVGIQQIHMADYFKVVAADVTCALVLTITGSAATTMTATAPTIIPYLHAEVAPGPLSKYTNAFSLT